MLEQNREVEREPPSSKDSSYRAEFIGTSRKSFRWVHIWNKDIKEVPLACHPSVCPLRCFVFPSLLDFNG